LGAQSSGWGSKQTMKARMLTRAAAAAGLFFVATTAAFSQGTAGDKVAGVKPVVAAQRVTQIDLDGLRKLLKPNGKPLLVDFWATWCELCRDEFPDIVKIDGEYRGKVDVITISLNEPAEIKTLVPKFLSEMKAEMPAYLLHTADEDAAINLISSDWAGNLPMTIIYGADGKVAFKSNGKIFYQGKIFYPTVAASLDKLLKDTPTK
jgi:thiol-disulfide isomerase/thioredoxin